MNDLHLSFSAGYGCLAAWADLIDRINVFPVADGDTGTNLRISLAPLRDPGTDIQTTCNLLARNATGNSGNIAAAFFQEFCQAPSLSELPEAAERGKKKSFQAIANPRSGTMLDIFDSLAQTLSAFPDPQTIYSPLSENLQQAVLASSDKLASCRDAGVVDSGALAMYIFFDGFFRHATGQQSSPVPVPELFAGKLTINSSFCPQTDRSFCVDFVLQPESDNANTKKSLADLGESVVVVEDASRLKVHIHTPDPGHLRSELAAMGTVLHWSDEKIDQHGAGQQDELSRTQSLHIMTDAAGSLPRETAKEHGITLLDSYIISGDSSRPESLYAPNELYSRMQTGEKITTAQASIFERHQQYQSACQQFGHTLYLCVGSAFTGNYDTALRWKKKHDPNGLLTIIDTGAASGRLALIALLTARRANNSTVSQQTVIKYAQQLISQCEEFVFIDELKYLVAGGRVSRVNGFFGDLLKMKPVVSPTSSGVKKMGIVRSKKEQQTFALNKLKERFNASATPVLLLNYSDNQDWVTGTVLPQIKKLLPEAEILITPLSLTSGVHMGPGTWSLSIAKKSPDTA